jgi:DnaJ-class molecular chaperone
MTMLPTCCNCNGTGRIVRQPLSANAMYALAKACPNEKVVTVEDKCPACHGSGVAVRKSAVRK